jgi:Ala-tRNA(Pro) deacylase
VTAPADPVPATPEELFARLDALGIVHQTHRHPPLFTVEQSKRLRGELPGAHCKNLFLRNKKGRMWLVVTSEDRAVDLKALGRLLGGAHLSFGSPERLMRTLGVTPGAVTPFGVVNDRAGEVAVVLDRTLLAAERLNFHPLSNDMTTAIAPDDLLLFLRDVGHEPDVRDLGAPPGGGGP